jgi:hypothetical protein
MSALAMNLTAAMVISGDRPEKVSGEPAQVERVDLSGEWKGKLTNITLGRRLAAGLGGAEEGLISGLRAKSRTMARTVPTWS